MSVSGFVPVTGFLMSTRSVPLALLSVAARTRNSEVRKEVMPKLLLTGLI